MADGLNNLDGLWDADAYWRAGQCPWTIFAYPSNLADQRRLPSDGEALRFLALLQSAGMRVGVWALPDDPATVYFACPFEDREQVAAAISQLERAGSLQPGFALRHCEHLFSTARQPATE